MSEKESEKESEILATVAKREGLNGCQRNKGRYEPC